MKNIVKNNIFCFILGVLITSFIGVAAYAYSAGQISYIPKDTSWKVKNVEEAINDLHEKNIFPTTNKISYYTEKAAETTTFIILNQIQNYNKYKYFKIVSTNTANSGDCVIKALPITKYNNGDWNDDIISSNTNYLLSDYYRINSYVSTTSAYGQCKFEVILSND